jgi:hypothetical protein
LLPDAVGQFVRVGPYTADGTRTQIYDWWVAETKSPIRWRQVDSIDIPYLQATYASIASVAQKAALFSPVFTGIPIAPTAPPATSTDQLATTAFVASAVASAVASGIAIFPSATPPTDTSVIWRDTNDNSLNVWIGGAWVADSSAAGALSDYALGAEAMAQLKLTYSGDGVVRFATRRAYIATTARTSTGYVKLVSQSGAAYGPFGTGTPSSDIVINVTPGGTGVRGFGILSTNSLGVASGSITSLTCASLDLAALSAAGASKLATLACSNNLLEYIDLVGCANLGVLTATDNRLKSVDSIFLSIASTTPPVGFVTAGTINVSGAQSAAPTFASSAARSAIQVSPRFTNIITN